MQQKQAPSCDRRHRIRIPLLICLAVIGILIMLSFVVGGQGAQENKKVRLSVEDPRPVAKAIEMLEERYGWIITYEDPRYVYAGDIADVTEKVRRDLDKFRPGEAPRVLIPRGGELSFEYEVISQNQPPSDPVIVLQRLLTAGARFGRFRLERDNNIIHVIPSAVRRRSGRFSTVRSVLDVVIKLPAKERTGLQTLEALCAAITNATQLRVVVGTIPVALFLQHKDGKGVTGRKAREVLLQLLHSVSHGVNLSWQLLYGPDMKMYALNIHVV